MEGVLHTLFPPARGCSVEAHWQVRHPRGFEIVSTHDCQGSYHPRTKRYQPGRMI